MQHRLNQRMSMEYASVTKPTHHSPLTTHTIRSLTPPTNYPNPQYKNTSQSPRLDSRENSRTSNFKDACSLLHHIIAECSRMKRKRNGPWISDVAFMGYSKRGFSFYICHFCYVCNVQSESPINSSWDNLYDMT
jgi:hypothetical protein